MAEKERISIALATYNGEKYIRAQMDSLLAQEVPFDELIICDDRSTDSTVEILREYAAADERIKLEVNEHNLGFRRNFEKAIRLCDGDLIALCDQDDIWLPDHLKILSEGIGSNLLIAGASLLADSSGSPTGGTLTEIKNFETRNPSQEQMFKFVMYYQNPFQGAAMMMRREFRAYALPVPALVAYHDVWFVHVATLLGEFRFVDVPVTLYRLHGGNTSGIHRRTPRLRTLAGHLLRSRLDTNRREVAQALRERARVFSPEALRLLEEACAYHSNRSLGRRLSNLIFELKNYGMIYGKE